MPKLCKINLLTEFAGQVVGIKEMADRDGWSAIGCFHIDFGIIDVEPRTRPTIDHRFGMSLSPMS